LAYIDSTGAFKIIAGTVTPQPGGTLPVIYVPEAWNINGNYNITLSSVLGSYNNAPLVIITNGGERMRITEDGNVGIGTVTPASKLQINADNTTNAFSVYSTTDSKDNFRVKGNGYVYARDVRVTVNTFSDFVFSDTYKLRTLAEVESYIKLNKHLPDVLSADEAITNGVSLGEMNITLLQKIEELTLYMIDMKKENDKLKERINTLENK